MNRSGEGFAAPGDPWDLHAIPILFYAPGSSLPDQVLQPRGIEFRKVALDCLSTRHRSWAISQASPLIWRVWQIAPIYLLRTQKKYFPTSGKTGQNDFQFNTERLKGKFYIF